ncbi:MAG: hypothetical protein QOJ04_2016 [Caballeronia sp.]|jgi:hypothetical protein|nr:hypothetical protein [Caballeronia sp.]
MQTPHFYTRSTLIPSFAEFCVDAPGFISVTFEHLFKCWSIYFVFSLCSN